MMSGEIWAESKPNKGSKFSFNIKIKVIDEKPIGEKIAQSLMSLRYKPVHKEENFIFEEMPHGRILIVDDVYTNLEVTKRLMKLYKMNIETAMSGYEALDKIKESKEGYDIIFMDYMMPGMDGIETTKIIRELGYKGIIVVLTANAVVGADKMFIENGFNDFISKPIDIKKLDAIIRKYVGKNQTANASTDISKISKRIQNMFKRDVDEAITMFKETIEAGDFKLFSVTARAIKFACANLGEKKASEFAEKLELASLNNNIDEIKEKYPILEDMLKKILEKQGAEK
jgi:CheY-like chemotaxis protein/HPt (histidine-containing phosphotransfer) domain-containing protein